MTNDEKQEVAENYLGNIDWANPTEGYCQCPGKAKHTTPNGPKDCIVYLDKVPTVHCFHQSCEGDTDEYSAPLRKLMAGSFSAKPFSKTKWSRQMKRTTHVKGLAVATRERLLQAPRPGPEQLANTLSPIKSREFFLHLFEPQDILWIGERTHSGWYGRGHFQIRAEWERGSGWWPFTCAGSFKPTHGFRRTQLNILESRYKVIEFDSLNPDPDLNKLLGLIFFLDLVATFKLILRMAVDTGGKSLHFWVDNDPAIFDEEFTIFLKALGADVRLLDLAQPVRCPGIARVETGKQQLVIVL